MHRVGDEVGLGVGDYSDTAERETFTAEKVRNKCQLRLQGQTDGQCLSAKCMRQCVFLSLLTNPKLPKLYFNTLMYKN